MLTEHSKNSEEICLYKFTSFEMFAYLLSFACSALIAQHEEKSFLSWMRQTNQIFTGDEYQFRLGIFLSNQQRVKQFNSRNEKTFTVGINKFACLTESEYKSLLGHKPRSALRNKVIQRITKKADESVDWRTKGIVNAVKDQGQCGSCWAFGTVQACESAYALATGTLNVCSEQNLVDCVTECAGCSGGLESAALDYILTKQDGYLMGDEDYPYKAYEQTCKFDKSKGINQIKSYDHGKQGDEEYLAQLVSQGVCDVAIDASNWSFQLYSGGIYDESACSSVNLDHAVGLVGYGTENGVDYWIIRNSWGSSWGEKGYIRMIRNKSNQCGVASDALQVYA